MTTPKPPSASRRRDDRAHLTPRRGACRQPGTPSLWSVGSCLSFAAMLVALTGPFPRVVALCGLLAVVLGLLDTLLDHH